MTRKEKITALLADTSLPPMAEEEIAFNLGVPEKSMAGFHKIITELIEEGTAFTDKKGRLHSSERDGLLKGVLHMSAKGFGFLVRDDGGDDLYISADDINGALNGDRVLVQLLGIRRGERPRGRVCRVCMRELKRFVGVIKKGKAGLCADPDDIKLPRDIPVLPGRIKGETGQKALFLAEYSPDGELGCAIEEVLGYPDDFGVDVLSIIKECGFNIDFPPSVLKEAAAVPCAVSGEDILGRLDLRDRLTITIDGDDSKDLDDAVSLEKTESGYCLGVHIADVSHYVRPRSSLDKEALKRGTSVYLVDRVIPMLPPRLSNGICSLNEGADRLTLSVIMSMDKNGNVIKTEFYKSVIKSARRMTYNNVWKIICGDEAVRREYSDVAPMIDEMYSLSLILKKKAAERGYVELDIPEAEAVLDENGRAADIKLRTVNGANELIEQFMVSANMAVAKYLWEQNCPTLYRVHDDPSPEKTEALHKFVKTLGYAPKSDLSALMEGIDDENDRRIIAVVALRSMAKAVYSPKNSGHYGLGAKDYCHFTSPIRRYPDLVCHRSLKAAIEHDENALKAIGKMNKDAAEISSEREAAAEKCERDVLSMKKAEYMEQFLGQEFEGIISSVTGFGFYVQLPNTVEGMVSLTSLTDDYYVFDEDGLRLIGERTKKQYRIGDKITVILAAASKQGGRITFVPKGMENTPPKKGKAPEPKKEVKKNADRKRSKNSRAKQKRVPRVLHRRKNRSRH